MKRSGLIILAIVAVLVIWGISTQRGLVGQDENVKNAWNKVQSAYQQRSDLVGQLVNTVKGVANFEQKTLTDVIEARSKATSINLKADDLTPENMAKFQQAQEQLKGSLSRLLVVAEQYPQLKATENFTKLQGQLEGIENGVKSDRNNFNDAVQTYNVKVRAFPGNILAGLFGFKTKEGFKADAGTEKAPEVKF
ncbi:MULTISPECIES: LemA family protein [Ferruginibacter]|uniref:LemA family protein n=1 Tax=Ferruginibacter sp. SUN106 TaxID=2978348 RepID=UPI003D36E796